MQNRELVDKITQVLSHNDNELDCETYVENVYSGDDGFIQNIGLFAQK